MGRFDRWLRRAAAAVEDETLLAALDGMTTVTAGERTGRRPCVLVATSAHVVLHVPRLRRSQTVVVAGGDVLDVTVTGDGRGVTITRADGPALVIESIEDRVALEAFVGVLDRVGQRHLPGHPAHARPGHGHVRAVPRAGT